MDKKKEGGNIKNAPEKVTIVLEWVTKHNVPIAPNQLGLSR